MTHTPRLLWLIEQATLAFSVACCSVVLYLALFPSFYYMAWFGLTLLLWIAVTIALLCSSLILAIAARRAQSETTYPRAGNLGFIAGMLVFVTALVGFKVPLHASFLLARPGLEEALAEHRDELAQVGLVHHSFGLYLIQGAHRGCHTDDRIFFKFQDDNTAIPSRTNRRRFRHALVTT